MFRLFRRNDSKLPVSSRGCVGRLVTGLACGFVLLGSLMSARAAFEWKVAQIDGRDYVSASDVKQFYGFPRLQRDGRAVWFRSQALMMKWNVGSDDIFINNVKFCLSFPVQERNGQAMVSRVDLAKLLHPIIRPSHIQNAVGFNTVVIDPGHGGEDSGAVGPYGAEKNYTLDTAFRLKRKLEAAGYRTVLTRSSDVFISRPGRVEIANRVPKAIFVSIHFNSFTSSAAGLETFALAPAGTANTDKALKESDLSMRRGNERDSESIALATAVHANCLYRLRGIDRGVERDRFDVLTGIERPGILVEGGFVSNPAEGAKIHRAEYRENLADAIFGGIQNYRKALLRGRPSGTTRATVRSGVAGSPPPESSPPKTTVPVKPTNQSKPDPKAPEKTPEPKKGEAKPSAEPAKPEEAKPASEPAKPGEAKPSAEPAKPEEAKPSTVPAKPEETKPSAEPAKPEEAKPASEPAKPEEAKPATVPAKPEEAKPSTEPAKPEEAKPAAEPAKPEEAKPSAEPAKPEEAKPATVPAKPEEAKPSIEPAKPEEAKPSSEPATEPAKTAPKPAARTPTKSKTSTKSKTPTKSKSSSSRSRSSRK